ncbi:hypothetical protein CR513_15962, partial [Mucuna pruriens]
MCTGYQKCVTALIRYAPKVQSHGKQVNQNAVGYAQASYATGPSPRNVRDPPYGMPQGWNTKIPTNEEQEQQNTMNNGPVFNTSSGAGPNTKEDSGAQH